jgi:putative ABC transport system permease protein
MTQSPNWRMFRRLWFRALTVKRPQAMLAGISLLVGAATISMLLNLYSDVRRKMTEEFSAYGANVVLAPHSVSPSVGPAGPAQTLPVQDQLMDQDLLQRLKPIERQVKGLIAVPRLDAVTCIARASGERTEYQNVVAVGVDFRALRKLSPSWAVEGRVNSLDSHSCAVGTNLADRLGAKVGEMISIEPFLSSGGGESQHGELERGTGFARDRLPPRTLSISNIVSTGSAEDDQVFLALAALQELAGVGAHDDTAVPPESATSHAPQAHHSSQVRKFQDSLRPQFSQARGYAYPKLSLVELYIPGEARQIESTINELRRAFAGTDVEVRPIRRILYSEGKVLGTVRGLMLWLTTLILVIIALCVTATMTAIVLERRKDVAVMKALGASNEQVTLLFLAESATLGLLAGVAGFVAGGIAASALGQRLFGVSLHWAWWAWPTVCGACVLLAAVATFLSVRSARRVEPAVVLKGN